MRRSKTIESGLERVSSEDINEWQVEAKVLSRREAREREVSQHRT